ncbi:uncharacterized protein [Phaseolus vulgaris]|uniref:uncharacterized protein n=1 Tax=Phaseolus vulgaris TaxID=3885 RepID=UPI0035CA5A74
MDTYSSAESSKPRSTHRAYVLNELKEARKALAQKDEELQRLEARMAKIELKQEGVVHSLHERQPSPRHSSKDWEAKCEQIFNTYEVEEDQKVKIATLEFVDYAMKWWHNYVTDICYNKRPPVVSWNDLVECMRFRFVPPHFRKDLMLKLQRFQQGMLSVDAYFKELETLLLKVNLRESEEALIARFVSGLRRDIQDVVELQEYSSLGSLVHLAMKVEAQIAKRHAFKNSPNDGYYNNSWKNRKSFSKNPSKESSFKPKESRPSTSNPKSPIKSSSKKCFKCMGYGHIAANCPSKRNMCIMAL